MAEEYRRQVDKLVKLVDGGTDPVDFIRASGTCTGKVHMGACVTMVTFLSVETQLQHDLAKAKHYMETEANPKVSCGCDPVLEGVTRYCRV